RSREAPVRTGQLGKRAGHVDAQIEVAAEEHRLARTGHSVDEDRGAQQLRVGQTLVGEARRMQVPDDERPVPPPHANGLADAPLLAPGKTRNEAEPEATRLSGPEAPRVENDVPVLDDIQPGTEQDRVS